MARKSKRWWVALSHEAIHQQNGVYEKPTLKPEPDPVRHEDRPLAPSEKPSAFKKEIPTYDSIADLTAESIRDSVMATKEILRHHHERGISLSTMPYPSTGSPLQSLDLRNILLAMAYPSQQHREVPTKVVDYIHDVSFESDGTYLIFKLDIPENERKSRPYFYGSYPSFDECDTAMVRQRLGSLNDALSKLLDYVCKVTQTKGRRNAWKYIVKSDGRPLESLYYLNLLYSPYEGSELFLYDIDKVKPQPPSTLTTCRTRSDKQAGKDMSLFNSLMGSRK